jgi:hypothetical protein
LKQGVLHTVTNVVLLDRQNHRGLRIQAVADAGLGDNQRFVQVVVTEFSRLVVHYPLLFSKDSDTGAFFCGAMMGFDAGENLFVKEGGGQESYRPLNLQRVPFFIARGDLAIDMDSPRVSTAKGEYLFTEAGEPTPYLESILTTFNALKPGLEMTKIFIETLMSHKLIAPIDIDLSFDDGEKRDLRGLYSIDQNVLRDLPDETVLELFRRGYLQLIYLMIASLKQVPVLAQKKNNRILQGSRTLSGSLV